MGFFVCVGFFAGFAYLICYDWLVNERTYLEKVLLISVVFLSFAHLSAIYLKLYWLLPWYDIMMHFAGGFFVMVLLLYLRAKHSSFKNVSWFTLLVGVICIGVLWELYEYVLKTTYSPEGYRLDTTMDLLMDVVGAVFGVLLLTNFRKKNVKV